LTFPKQLTPTQAKRYKAKLIQDQGGLCKLCKRPLSDDMSKVHLDHCHDTGHIRGALHSHCNRTEGKLKSVYKRMGGDPAIYFEWLTLLSDYLQKDSTENPLHPQHMTDQIRKFKAKSKPEQEAELNSIGVAFDIKATKADLTKLYTKHLKSFTK
jgi:hypothetical protein